MDLTAEQSQTIKDVRAEYYREWRAKNPDKVKDANHRYWLKKAEERKKAVANNGGC